jgi:hypothetical protein
MGPERSWLLAIVGLVAATVVLVLALLVNGSQPGILPCQPHSLTPGGPLVCDGVPPQPQHEDAYPTDAPAPSDKSH